MDGLDMCLAQISLNKDYIFNYKIISTHYEKFDEDTINFIKKTINNIKFFNGLHEHLGKVFLSIVDKYYSKGDMDIISMHGQTIRHIDKVKSIQCGNPKFLNNEFKVPVVYNFRETDIIEGGNGAPLMPFLDWLLFKTYLTDVVTLNVGGISNISHIKKQSSLDEVIGFDTGPGMSLIDEFVFLKWKLRYDLNGELSSKGVIVEELLNYLMNHKYLAKIPPKSTGRDVFGFEMLKSTIDKFYYVDKIDFLRTLVRFSAESIIFNLKYLKNLNLTNTTLIISGGGINNKLLMYDIKEISDFSNIITSNSIGINPDFKESLLMSVLGLGRIMNLKTNVPSVTGAGKLVSCGDIYA